MRHSRSAFLLTLLAYAAPLMAQVNTMTAGTTWEGGTWSLGHTPTLSEDAVISSGLSVTLSSSASCQSLSVGTSSASATTLTVISGGNLTVFGLLSINPNHQTSTFILSVAEGIVNVDGNVQVSPAGTNVVSVGNGTLNFTSTNNFEWNDGTLTITGASGQTNFSGLFSLNSGTLAFDQGTTRFNAGFTRSGGTLTSNGNGEQIVIDGPLTANSTLTFDPASTVTFNGTSTITPNSPVTFGSLTVDFGASVSLAGSISLASANSSQANLTIQDGTLDLASYSADRTTLGGTLTLGMSGVLKVGGSGTFPDNYFTHSIHSSSEVQYSGSSQVGSLNGPAKYGILSIAGSNVGSTENFSVAGSLTVGSGAQLSMSMGMVTMHAGSSIENASGSLELNHLTMTGSGTVTGSGDYSVTGNLHVGPGTTFSTSGTTTMLDGSSIQNSGTLDLSGLTIDNDATVESSGGFSVSGTLAVAFGAVFEPSGTVTMKNGSVIDNSSTLTFSNLTIATSASVDGNSFGVEGTLSIGVGATFAPTGLTTMSGVGWSVVNDGTLIFSDLTIAATPSAQTSASFSIEGTLTVNPGATFAPTDGVVTLSGTSWGIANNGTLTFKGITVAGTPSTQPSSPFSVSGPLTVNASQTFAPTSATVTMTGSGWEITNNGTLTFKNLTVATTPSSQSTSSFSVSGTISASPGATFAPIGGTVTMTGTGWGITGGGTLTFRGLTIAGTASSQPSTNFSVSGTLTVNASTTFAPINGTLTMTGSAWGITNNGTLTFRDLTIAGTPVTQPTASFSLGGVLTVNGSATFAPASGTITASSTSWGITNNGSLTFNNLTIGATPFSQTSASFNIAGTLTVNSGISFIPAFGSTITMTGTDWKISNSGTLTFRGLTVFGTPSSQPTSPFGMNGALLVYSGTLLPTGAVTMNNGSSAIVSGGTISPTNLSSAIGASVTLVGVTIPAGGYFTVGAASYVSVTGLTINGGSTVVINSGGSLVGPVATTSTIALGSTNLTILNNGTFSAYNLSVTSFSPAMFSTLGGMSLGGTLSLGSSVTFSPDLLTLTGSGTLPAAGTFSPTAITLSTSGTYSLSEDVFVQALTLTSGTIFTGASLLTVTSSSASGVTATNGTVNGRLRRYPANDASTYVFNDAATSITRVSGSNPTEITIRSYPNTSVPYGTSAQHAQRYYSITSTGGSGSWSLGLSYRNAAGGSDVDERNSLDSSTFLIQRGNGSSWTAIQPSTRAVVSNPLRSAKVTATVTSFGDFTFGGYVAFALSVPSISFGDVGVNLSQTASVTVSNGGSMTLSISSASIDSTAFSVSPSSASVSPGDSTVFSVTFAPGATGAKTGALVFTSNASSTPDSVTLSGNGFRPAITSFTPVSSLVGGSVTLSGTFSSTLANNVVRFGGVEGNVTSGSTSQLTVTVPAGATQVPVSVTAAGLSAASPKAFVPVHPETTAISSNTFAPYASFSSISNATQVLASDIDGDGQLDLVYLRPGSSVITFLRNTSSPGSLSESSFAGGVDLAIRANARSMALGDLNGDGRVDLCVTSDSADGSSTGVIMYLNESTSGSIVFTADHGVSVTDSPDGVAVGDLDGDGRNDVVVRFMHYATSFQNGLKLLRNTTTGDTLSFSGDQILTSQFQYAPGAVSVRDIDLDGLPEILITGSNGSGTWYGTINVWKNYSTIGAISMSLWSTLVTQNFHYGTRDVMAVDFDGDEYPDPIMLSSSTVFSYFRNNSGSSFGSRQTLTLTNRSLSGGDLDGDGLAELLVANNSGVSVYSNTSTSGTISFGTRVDLSTGGSTVWSVLADLDGDGRMDIASANGGGGVVRTKGLPSEPSTAPSAFAFVNSTDTSITIQWSKGNGDSTFILLRSGEAVSSGVSDAVRYTANTTFGNGTQVGTGNYVVASTGDSSVTIYGLQPSTTYYYAAYSFNGGGDQYLENYLTSSPSTGNTSTEAPLPVQMVGMNAEVRGQNSEVRLSWKTASEIDNLGWEVERRTIDNLRLMSADYQKIGFVEGSGTSSSPREYSFADRTLFDNRPSTIGNRIVYRLKQLDRSGSFAYSHEVEVEIGTVPREFTLSQNYPNPFNPTTTIQFTVPQDGRATLKIFDMLGREVATLVDEVVKAGVVQRAVFDAARLASGMYIARLTTEHARAFKKLQLVK